MKNVRNALLKGSIKFNGVNVSPIPIIKVFEYDKMRCTSIMPKITEAHIHPSSFQKMNVRLAVQLLSRTVACAIRNFAVDPTFFAGTSMAVVNNTANFCGKK